MRMGSNLRVPVLGIAVFFLISGFRDYGDVGNWGLWETLVSGSCD